MQFLYNGPSMNPTLKPGDRLRVVPYGNRGIGVGDVVVIRAPEGKRNVAHRVVSVGPRGVKTRGDNNNQIDSWLLRPEEIIGRVISAQRGTKSISIHGGRRGAVYASVLRPIKHVNLTISRLLHPVYRRLSESGIFRRALPRRARLRVLCFTRPDGLEMHLYMGGWFIGRRRPGWERWQVRPPFRLFVDEGSLPR